MDSWSKGDYSRVIREVSMVVEKLPVVIPPPAGCREEFSWCSRSWKRRRWRNRDGIAKRVPVLRVSEDALNIWQRGASGKLRGAQAPPPPGGAQGGGGRPPGRLEPWWPPRLPFGRTVVSGTLIFYIIFLDSSWQFS